MARLAVHIDSFPLRAAMSGVIATWLLIQILANQLRNTLDN